MSKEGLGRLDTDLEVLDLGFDEERPACMFAQIVNYARTQPPGRAVQSRSPIGLSPGTETKDTAGRWRETGKGLG